MAQGGRRLSQRQRQRQRERQARRARRQARRRVLRWGAFGIIGFIALALIGGLLVSPGLIPTGGGAKTRVLSAEERAQGPGEHLADLGREHIQEGTTFDGYNSTPPTSGPHWDAPSPWGIYKEPIPNERQVHNLEHGGVLIQYNTGDEELITQVEGLAKSLPGFPGCIIAAPYPDMEPTIALTAWGVLLTLDNLDEEAIRGFTNFYRDQGPERVDCRDV